MGYSYPFRQAHLGGIRWGIKSELPAKAIEGTSDVSTENRRAIDVVVADKSPLILAALSQIFSSDERFALVASASDGERFMEAVERLSFDIGVIGWEMPYMDGAANPEPVRRCK